MIDGYLKLYKLIGGNVWIYLLVIAQKNIVQQKK